MEKMKIFSVKVSNWLNKHKKKIRLLLYYIISVIISTIIIIDMRGGIQATLHLMNDYPEQKYQQLEQELQNILVESDGIYPEELSNDSIKYDISYMEQNNSEGKYTITLIDDVTITGTIGKDFKKEDLIIEREYETESEYRKQQYVSTIAIILLIPTLPIVFICAICFMIFIIAIAFCFIIFIIAIVLTIILSIFNLITDLIMFLVKLSK